MPRSDAVVLVTVGEAFQGAPVDHRQRRSADVRRRASDARRVGRRVCSRRRLRVHEHPRRRHRAAGARRSDGWVIVAGLFSFSWAQAFDFPPEARRLDANLVRAMAAAGLLAMYNYGGYSNICNIGEEIRCPERTMPRAIVLSIVIVVVLYVVMSTVILGMVPAPTAGIVFSVAFLAIAVAAYFLFEKKTAAPPGRGAAAPAFQIPNS